MDLKYTIDVREPKESNDVRFVALRCAVFELARLVKIQWSFQLKGAAKPTT